MGIELLIIADPKPPYLRGEPITAKEQPCTWGTREVPPRWIRLIIPDATVAQADAFLEPLKSVFSYEVLAQNENGKRIRISINPRIVEVFGADKGMRADLYEFLQNEYGAQNVSALSDPPFDYVLDFPDPDLNLQEVKTNFEDVAEEQLAPHRYHFSDSDVDAALTQGGVATLTRAQAANRIIDRLA